MICPRCKSAMKEEKRSFHKKRKWLCPECGKTRMQIVGNRGVRKKEKHKGKRDD